MSVPAHVVTRQAGVANSERDRVVLARQLLLGRYLDPWGPSEIVWCHSHTLVRGRKVIHNVYDILPPRLNGCLSALGLGGAFHSGIEVAGTEYAFGGHPNDELGITALKQPLFELRRQAEQVVRRDQDDDGAAAASLEWMPMLRSRTVVGWWMGPLSEVEELLRQLRFEESWAGSSYRLLSRNCNHFAHAMCAALLLNPYFKPAPGRSSADKMVPPSVTRLSSFVLALGCCAPCLLRRLNVPMPLAPHGLNVFQGQSRKAGPEVAAARSRRVRSSSGVPVQSSYSRSRLASGGSAGGAGGIVCLEQTANGRVRIMPYVPTPAGAAAAAAAAAERRSGRQRLEGKYQSLRVEAVMSPAERAARCSARRTDDDGASGFDSSDRASHRSTTCSTPDLAAVACNGRAQDLRRASPETPTASSSRAVHDGSPSEALITSQSLTTTAAAAAAAATPMAFSIDVPRPSLSLPPLLLMSDGAHAAAAAAAVAAAGPPSQRSGPRFLGNSRSGRRVFPDPRVAAPGVDSPTEGGADGGPSAALARPPTSAVSAADANDSAAALAAAAANGSNSHPRSAGLFRQQQQQQYDHHDEEGGLEKHPDGASGSGRGDGMGTGSGSESAGQCRSPQHQHVLHPSTSSLPSPYTSWAPPTVGTPRGDGSRSTSPRAAAVAPPPPPLPLSHTRIDGARSSSSQQQLHDQARPWSVLSGGFVDLLFNRTAHNTPEPPPGVPGPLLSAASSFAGDAAPRFSAASNATRIASADQMETGGLPLPRQQGSSGTGPATGMGAAAAAAADTLKATTGSRPDRGVPASSPGSAANAPGPTPAGAIAAVTAEVRRLASPTARYEIMEVVRERTQSGKSFGVSGGEERSMEDQQPQQHPQSKQQLQSKEQLQQPQLQQQLQPQQQQQQTKLQQQPKSMPLPKQPQQLLKQQLQQVAPGTVISRSSSQPRA